MIWFLMMMLQNRRRRILSDDDEPRLNILDFRRKTGSCPINHVSGAFKKVWCEWSKTSATSTGLTWMILRLWAPRGNEKKHASSDPGCG